jgi:hypothetical protein
MPPDPDDLQTDADLHAVLQQLLPMALEFLASRREFYPFGGALDGNGRFAFAEAPSDVEAPSAQQVLDAVYDTLRTGAMRGAYRAVGIAADVRVTPPGGSEATDALFLEIEHASGICLHIYYPYTVSADQVPQPGAPFGGRALPHLFPRVGDA